MRIVVNDIAASCGGAMTVLNRFYDAVRQYDTENEWIFLLSDRYVEETERISVLCFPEIKRSHIKKLIFDCLTGRKTIEALHPDVVVSFQNIITFGVKEPQLLYIQQSIPFQSVKRFSFLKSDERSMAAVQYLIGALIKASAKRADGVVVQTKWMKEAVERMTGISGVQAILPAAEPFPKDLAKFCKRRFFYPTNGEKYKNIDLIVQACNALEREGIQNFDVYLTLDENAVANRHIHCIGYLDKARLQEEYQSATLLFPSYIETVGLPLLEARSCGVPVLASDTPFSRECLNGYENAIYFDPFRVDSLVSAMKQSFSMQSQDQEITLSEDRSRDKLLEYILQWGGEMK